MDKFAIARDERKKESKFKENRFAKPKDPKPAVTVTPMPEETV